MFGMSQEQFLALVRQLLPVRMCKLAYPDWICRWVHSSGESVLYFAWKPIPGKGLIVISSVGLSLVQAANSCQRRAAPLALLALF